jgi:Na+/melibiose symporter-like transporter
LKDVSRSAPHLEARQQEEHQHVWQYVLVVMIAIMIIETFVAARMGRRRLGESQ